MESDGNLEEKKSRRSKDVEEVKNAREKLAELKGKGGLQRKIEKANKQLTEDIAEVEQVTGKIVKLSSRLRKVSKGAGPGGGEMAQEEKDKYLFTQELKRIVCERAIYGLQGECRT
jgi:rRNA maturation endonuclease Nob1